MRKSSQIKYLSLEGGGGKGNAFIGAIKALEDLNRLPKNPRYISKMNDKFIQGFSGSSAGAITAFFLSIGYNSEEIAEISKITDFNQFFDDPVWNTRFSPAMKTRRIDYIGIAQTFKKEDPESIIGEIVDIFLNWNEDKKIISQAFLDCFDELLIILLKVKTKNNEALKKILLGDNDSKLKTTLKSIKGSLGIFPGLEIRWFFQKWLVLAYLKRLNTDHPYRPKRDSVAHIEDFSKAWKNIQWPEDKPGDYIFRLYPYSLLSPKEKDSILKTTFSDHFKTFSKTLCITGSNLETFQSHIFSHFSSPNFLVIDAVRISMGLPLIYKPMIITEKDLTELKLIPSSESIRQKNKSHGDRILPHWMIGVWVDGGIFNNMPMHAFERFYKGSQCTFGLRLSYETPAKVESLYDFATRYLQLLLGAAGESHMSNSNRYYNKTVILDSVLYDKSGRIKKTSEGNSEIDLMMFNVGDKELLSGINVQSYESVMNYFNRKGRKREILKLLDYFK